VLKAFEAIPDSQYRAMLRPLAHSGAQRGAPWVDPVRASAAKALGVSSAAVKADQVADHFLDLAVARKNGLRGAFTSFFAGLGHASAATKLSAL
jgi:hypothetical protein